MVGPTTKGISGSRVENCRKCQMKESHKFALLGPPPLLNCGLNQEKVLNLFSRVFYMNTLLKEIVDGAA